MATEAGTQVRITAIDKREGMTLGELRRWLALTLRVNLPDDSRVRIESGFRSQITTITATAPATTPDDAA